MGGTKYRFLETPEGHLHNVKGGKFDNHNLNHLSNSNLSVPNWTNSELNAKGRSLNPHPKERFDNSADSLVYSNGA